MEEVNLTSPREIKKILERYKLYPRKKWGQNFLVDGNIVAKILREVSPEESDHILEVGPGLGTLTLPMVKTKAFVSAFEIDRGFVLFLKELLAPYNNHALIEGDIRRISLRDYCDNFSGDICKRIKLVANLPYYITSPFIYEITGGNIYWDKAVLMIQKEMAQKLVAEAGSSLYGTISVLCGAFTKTKIVFPVSPNVFFPLPKVDSAVVVIEPQECMLNFGEKDFFIRLVSGLFNYRRKTVLNTLSRLFGNNRPVYKKMLADAGIAEDARPESLPPALFANLSLLIYNSTVD